MNNELYHSGIKGQKWGIRRYQNEDGTYTAEGKERRRKGSVDWEKAKSNAKKVGKAYTGVSIAALSAAAAYSVMQNPAARKAAADKAVKVFGKVKAGFVAGAKEGLEEGPKKLGKAVTIGIVMLAGKEICDQIFGKDESDSIFKANDKDKIAKFWPKKEENQND